MIHEALKWKYPDAVFVTHVKDGKIVSLDWQHPRVEKPNEIEIEAIKTEYITFKSQNLYKEKRASDYPSLGDQLDAIWKLLGSFQRGEGLTEEQQEGLSVLDSVIAVKAKYPKPQTDVIWKE